MISFQRSYQSNFYPLNSRFSGFISALLFLFTLLISQHSFATKPVVNINHAGAQELAEKLFGIGPAKARAIVEFRELHGPFETVDELIKVKGIGPRTLEKNRAQLIVDSKDWLAHDQIDNAAITYSRVHSAKSREKATRHAVRAVIDAARRDGTTR